MSEPTTEAPPVQIKCARCRMACASSFPVCLLETGKPLGESLRHFCVMCFHEVALERGGQDETSKVPA